MNAQGPKNFNYTEAFSRNLGWITEIEAKKLGQFKVAIAGVGGVGGQYCEVLARLGIRKFHLADPDTFELANFNRQNGSGVSSIGKQKLEVIRSRILDINPEAEITIFEDGLTPTNLEAFLDGADIYLDGLDFFVLDVRVWLFAEMQRRSIPAIISAPVGMGSSILVFDKHSMSFAQYFGISPELAHSENAVRFLSGLTPTLMQAKYQADKSRVDFEKKRVPSTPMAVYLCAGVAATTALKLLLNRSDVRKAPWCSHFDAYLMTLKHSYVWGGYRNPLQAIKRIIIKHIIKQGQTLSGGELS
jgi:molybdopterin/thiamine biosynthesis adenylyltransferase